MSTLDRSLRQRLADLQSPDPETRRLAVYSFRYTRSQTGIAAVINALDDPHTRAAAADVLSGHKGVVHAVPKLISLITDSDVSARGAVIEALAAAGDHRAVAPLAALLGDFDESVRLDAARALGSMGDRRAIQPLLDAIAGSDPEDCIREIIWHELGEFGFADEVQSYSHLLHSPDWTIRPNDRLDLLEPRLQPIRRLLRDEVGKIRRDIAELASADYKVVQRAMSRLGRRRGQVVELLAEATASPNSAVRHQALHVLERLGDPRAGAVVLEMANDPVLDTRWCAYEILGKLWKERAVPILADVLRNIECDSAEADGACRGLVAVGSPAIPALSDMIDSGDPDLRQQSAWVLRFIPDEAVIEPLSRLLSDPDSVTRWTGIESLSRLGQDNPKSFGQRCSKLIEPLARDLAQDVREVAVFELGELRAALRTRP